MTTRIKVELFDVDLIGRVHARKLAYSPGNNGDNFIISKEHIACSQHTSPPYLQQYSHCWVDHFTSYSLKLKTKKLKTGISNCLLNNRLLERNGACL